MEPTLSTAAIAVAAVAIYSLIQEATKRLFRKTRAGDDTVTLNELIDHCQRAQASCSAIQIVGIVKTNMEEMRKELKAEMSEIRKLVIDVIKKEHE